MTSNCEQDFAAGIQLTTKKSSIMSNCPSLISKTNMPKVLWYQTGATVVMKIMLPGVERYFLRIDEDHVRFSTIIEDRNYYVCIYLFGAVIPEKCTHFNKGREIAVHLPKAHRWDDWPRLGIDKRKNPQVISDFDKVEDQPLPITRTDEFQAYLKKYMRQNNITQILPDGPSSNEEESDDEMMDMLFD